MAMADNYFGITDTGRVRTNNEDAFIAQKVLGGRYIAACVIDGVGGYEGGEVAAALAKQSILDYFSVSSGDVVTMMKEAFVVANEKITAEKDRRPQLEGMACVATLAMVDLAAKTFYYAHIGDTRLYLLRDNSLVKISKDQSFVGYLEDSGRLSEEEAMQHPKRNEINKAIGFEAYLNPADIETGTSPFLPGDTILLCSDGLSDLLTSSEITSVLVSDKTLPAKGAELVRMANERGGKDNITVVLVRNHKRPVVQKATKPKAAEKPEPVKQTQSPTAPVPPTPKRRSGKGIMFLLAALCVGLAATVAVLWFQKNGSTKDFAAPLTQQKSSLELDLQNTLDTITSGIFSLPDSLAALPVVLTDTIWIRQDSVHIQGNGMGFLKSLAYNGPAFALAESCNYVLLENLTLQNFDVGVLAQNRAVYLKNVRFIACSIPVLSRVPLPDGNPVSGRVTSFFTPDSLLK
jgi:serine/threonine protein phosphatase PrpC